ncbi:hypothetical protein K8I61_03665 [bacterium]|nr:hypothetical protein [bacterium]
MDIIDIMAIMDIRRGKKSDAISRFDPMSAFAPDRPRHRPIPVRRAREMLYPRGNIATARFGLVTLP